MQALDKRKVAVLLVEVQMSNPNGDPDAGNAPRHILGGDGNTYGFMTDSSVKRKVRDTAKEFHKASLYVDHGAFRSEVQARYPSADAMLRDMWDVRVFGGTLTNFNNKGRITGPIQINLAQTAYPIEIVDIGITCVAGEKKPEDKVKAGNEKRRKKQEEAGIEAVEVEDLEQLRANMGRKQVVQHALIPIHIFFNPSMGERTGLSEEDLAVFWDSLITCWDFDKAGGRTGVRFRRLLVFEHNNFRGVEHSHKTIERVKIGLAEGVEEPRQYSDYEIRVDLEGTEGRIEVFDYDDSTFSLITDAAA